MSKPIDCGTFKQAPNDPDDPAARLSPEFEQAVRKQISAGRTSPSVRVLYGEVVAVRHQLAARDAEIGRLRAALAKAREWMSCTAEVGSRDWAIYLAATREADEAFWNSAPVAEDSK